MTKRDAITDRLDPLGFDVPDRLMERVADLADFAKGLADVNRVRILLIVARGRKSVSRIVEEAELSQPLVSHHLRELRRCGLVKVEREGPFVFYEIAGSEVLTALSALAMLKSDRKY